MGLEIKFKQQEAACKSGKLQYWIESDCYKIQSWSRKSNLVRIIMRNLYLSKFEKQNFENIVP